MNPYESRKLLDEYLLFHYGTHEEVLPYETGPHDALGFAVRTVTENIEPHAGGRALDIGCAVGRSSFELSRFCDEVIGIDYSSAFVEAAETIRGEGLLKYQRLEEAHRSTELSALVPPESRPEAIRFETGDAMDLRNDLGSFDVVHAANLLCRLREPAELLKRFPDLVSPGGQLVLTTPCTWLGEFTPPEKWPDKPTVEWLEDHLGDAFRRTKTRDMPFLIRETARKFQWTVAQASVWERITRA